MTRIARIGIDTSKSVFQLHGVDESERIVLQRQLRRQEVLRFLGKLEPTSIGLEACGASHYWAAELQALGHTVVLIPPQYVKPYVARGKHDAADAGAICEAMSRPRVARCFVPVKSAEQMAAQMLLTVREQLIRRRTQLSNSIRGHAAEFGLIAAKGLSKIEPLPVGACLLPIKIVNPHAFRSGRMCAAWIGLTPKNHSTAGKHRLGGITRAGDEALRAVMVAGATAYIQQVRRGRTKPSPWLDQLLKHTAPKHAAVALANKTARIAWKLMVSGQRYQRPHATTQAAVAA